MYNVLKNKYAPFIKKKSVVHKSELNYCPIIENQLFFGELAASWVKIQETKKGFSHRLAVQFRTV
jgi:hypothetical protein